MSGKFALVIGNTEYLDPGLAQLSAPGQDAEDLARILQSPDLCAFDDVKVLLNQNSAAVMEAVEELFEQKSSEDLLLLYFSGHGVRDDQGTLYLATRNTNRLRLLSTAVKSDSVRAAMDHSRSKRQVLILDCCNSGAFAVGTKAPLGASIGTATAFEAGYGRIILTATDATQFAWEGDRVIGETANSLFTHYLVTGLQGEADLDDDGRITVDELYDYVYEKVKLATPTQTPSKFSSKQQGEIVLRQGISGQPNRPALLPEDLLVEAEDTRPYVREVAVQRLEKYLKGRNIGLARSARAELERIIADENTTRRVAHYATQVLGSVPPPEEKAADRPPASPGPKPVAPEAEEVEPHVAAQQRPAEPPAGAVPPLAQAAGHELEPGSATRSDVLPQAPAAPPLVEQRPLEEESVKARKESEPKKRRPAAHFVYVIARDGTALYRSLPASDNWDTWLERGSQLSILGAIRDARQSIGKTGHYLEVADSGGSRGFVAARELSFERPTAPLGRSTPRARKEAGQPAVKPETAPAESTGSPVLAPLSTAYAQARRVWTQWPLQQRWAVVGGLTLILALIGLTFRFGLPGSMPSTGPVSRIAATSELYFTSNRQAGKSEIYEFNVRDGELAPITNTPANAESWSPFVAANGLLYFTSNRDDNKDEIFRVDLNSRELSRITNTPGTAGSWSPFVTPDGNMYFTSNRQDYRAEIYRMNLYTADVSRITNTPGGGASWSPFVTPGAIMYFTSNRNGNKPEIYRMDLYTGALSQVTSSPGGARSWSPFVTADGVLFFTSDREQSKPEIYSMNLYTGGISRVTNTSGTAGSWTPFVTTDRVLYFVSDREDRQADIYRLDLRSGKGNRVTHSLFPSESWFSISDHSPSTGTQPE